LAWQNFVMALKIGIIGTGNMGRALGTGWVQAGHEVLFGSHDLAKARNAAGDSAKSGDFDDAAAFGAVVLYTVRDVLPSKLLRAPKALAGKILIDCTNSAILGLEASTCCVDAREYSGRSKRMSCIHSRLISMKSALINNSALRGRTGDMKRSAAKRTRPTRRPSPTARIAASPNPTNIRTTLLHT
jgi:NADP oxidoreductase coenzyme F420-dependent